MVRIPMPGLVATSGLLLALVGPVASLAQDIPPEALPENPPLRSVLELGVEYLEALYRLDYEALAVLLAEDAVFDDPTSIAVDGQAWHYEGRDAIIDFFRSSSEGVAESSFEIGSSFSTGEFAVMSLTYRAKGDGAAMGVPGRQIELLVPGVTVLRFRNGLVVHHLDHIDYASMMQQVEKQAEAGTTP